MIRQRPQGGGLGPSWDLVPSVSYEGLAASISPVIGSIGRGFEEGRPISAFGFHGTGRTANPASVSRAVASQHLPETPAAQAARLPPAACVPGDREASVGGLGPDLEPSACRGRICHHLLPALVVRAREAPSRLRKLSQSPFLGSRKERR